MKINQFHADFLDQAAPIFAQKISLCALAIIALPMLLRISLPILSVFVFFWLVRFVMVHLKIGALSKWQVYGLFFLLVIILLTQIKSIFGQDGGISFLLAMVLLKSFESKNIRDWQVLLLSTLFLTVVSLLFSQNIPNALWSVFCLFVVLSCINLLDGGNLKHATSVAFYGLLFSLPLTILFFIAIPRLPEPLARFIPMVENTAETGLSSVMSPSSFSQLVQNDEPVFNAVFKDFTPKNNQLYWRVLIMPQFDGHSWHERQPSFVDDMRARFENKPSVEYEIFAKDWNGHIPVLDYAISEEPRRTHIYHTATVMVWRLSNQVQRFKLESVLTDKMPEPLPQQMKRSYLKLPENLNPKTKELAQDLYQQSNSDAEFVNLALRYFVENKFVYTLKPPALDGYEDEVDVFLFQTRQGFCGHYASAFAVLMRSVGVPARVVTGYQGGTYDESAKFWQIRSKDAHAWTEVWLSETQEWVRVDPTAVISSRADSGVSNSLLNGEKIGNHLVPYWVSNMIAKGQFYWQVWVLDYDSQRQNNLFNKIGLGNVGFMSVLVLIICGGLIAILPMLMWWRWRLYRQQDLLQIGFLKLKTHLLGDDNVKSQGPLDFLKNLQNSGSLNNEIKSLIDEYINLRYRNKQVSVKETRRWFKKAKRYWKKY